MSKAQINTRCPRNLQRRIDQFREANDLDSRSEAARQLMQRGADDWEATDETGEELCRQATVVSGVALVGALSMIPMGAAWAGTVAAGFGSTTIVFAAIWAAIRILSEGGIR